MIQNKRHIFHLRKFGNKKKENQLLKEIKMQFRKKKKKLEKRKEKLPQKIDHLHIKLFFCFNKI